MCGLQTMVRVPRWLANPGVAMETSLGRGGSNASSISSQPTTHGPQRPGTALQGCSDREEAGCPSRTQALSLQLPIWG